MKFLHPTTAQVLKLASLALVIVNTLLAFGATIHTVPGIPPAVAVYWPVVYGVAFGLHQLASNFGIAPDSVFQTQMAGVVQGANTALTSVQATIDAIDKIKLATSPAPANDAAPEQPKA